MNFIFSSESLALLIAAVSGVLAVNIFLLVLFILFTWHFLKRLALSQQEGEQQKQEAYRQAKEMIDKTRREAVQMLEDAAKKSALLVGDMQMITDDTKRNMNESLTVLSNKQSEQLQRVSEEIVSSYKTLINRAEAELGNTLKQSLEASSEQASKTADQFQGTLAKELARYQQAVDTRFNEWHAAAQKQIDEYKQESMKKIESSIYQIIVQVSQQVIGKSLDLQQHQDLVMHALEEAKKDGFFS